MNQANLLTYKKGQLSIGFGPFRPDGSMVIGGQGFNASLMLCVLEKHNPSLRPEVTGNTVNRGHVVGIPGKHGRQALCVVRALTQPEQEKNLFLRVVNSECPRPYSGSPAQLAFGRYKKVFDTIYRLRPNESVVIINNGKSQILFNLGGQAVWSDFNDWKALKLARVDYQQYIFPTVIASGAA